MPQIHCDQFHPQLSVADVRAAVDFYTAKLGFSLDFCVGDPADFAAVHLGKVQMFFAKGMPAPDGLSVYFVVDGLDDLYEFQRQRGVNILAPPQDQSYGLRDYAIRDLYGYKLQFGHHLPDSEPLEIERVDVPVRLEKRLAAALTDLAAHKRMSVSSCLEETLLHTFEKEEGGVPSPHSPRTLDFIQELKKKHGIDYDAHASYRFVEETKKA
jgi:uncharacterized glyoxalase superfamily protein PhnB